MRYVLDTNILVLAARNGAFYKSIADSFNIGKAQTTAILSVVSLGEVYALAKANRWGNDKMRALKTLLDQLIIIDINQSDAELLYAYVQFDLYSANKLANNKLPTDKSARKMGKNDLWIAATAYATQSDLITTDQDFENLHDKFLQIHCVKPNI